MMKCIALLTTLAAIMFAETITDLTPWETKPPAKPQFDIWIEGESFSEQAGGERASDGDCYGGKCWNIYGPDKKGSVQYEFSVVKKGRYLVSVAGQQIGAGWTSPVSYAIDGVWVDATKAPSSSVSWGAAKAVKWTLLALADLSEGSHTLAFKVEDKRPMDNNTAYRIDAIAFLRDPFSKASGPLTVITGRAGNVYTEDEPLTFRTKTRGPERKALWRVTDFYGTETAQGDWLMSDALTLPDLPCGYYRFHYKDENAAEFSEPIPFVRVISPSKRKRNTAGFFCVDTAQSWLVSPGRHPLFPPDTFVVTSDLVKLAGIDTIRDRYSFNQLNPSSNEYKWDNVYSSNAALLKARGIEVDTVFHDAPQWTKGKLTSMPYDLFALYRFCRESAARYRGTINAWEFWNEPDISFCKDPAWDFAAAQKAAYLGIKAGNPDASMLIASSAEVPLPRFFDLALENGTRDYFDIMNYHIYKKLHEIAPAVETVTNFLMRHGIPGKPMWVTENGIGHEGFGKRRPLISNSSAAEYDDDQERLHAEHLTKSMVILQSLGVARDFFFVFPPYNEKDGGKVWGLFRWDFTAKPAYAAFANLTARLANAVYKGRVNAGDGVSAYLYEQPDTRQTLVFWSDSNDNRQFSVSTGSASISIYDIMGKNDTAASEKDRASFTAQRYIQYADGCRGIKPSSLPPSFPAQKKTSAELDIVLRATLSDGFSIHSKTTARIEADGGKLSLDVFNFGSSPKTVALKNLNDATCSIDGLPAAVSVPPQSFISVPLSIHTATSEATAVSIGGAVGAKTVAPIVIPVFTVLAGNPAFIARTLPADEPSRWRINASGELKIERDASENAVRFDVQFKPNTDFWVYPEFMLSLPNESLSNAVGMSFDIKCGDISPKGFAYNYVMLVVEGVKETGRSFNLAYPPPTKEWKTVNINFGADASKEFKPADTKVIRIGMNPKQEKFTYWVRNITVYLRK
ncbi:MAG: hypothetical protein HZC28_05080 [Spirochaetes bacterium]|nr:hypothetical protein [Spirochaetota bacterium]